MKKFKDVMILGFALFAMFLGAGNIIFPPTLGFIAGQNWLITLLGFGLTGVGLPILGIVAAAKAGGGIQDVPKYLGPKIAFLFTFLVVMAIGPLLAIPRTAAVTYELGIRPIFSNLPPIVVVILFFLITIYFTINATTVVDKVGSILTPILIVVLVFIIVNAVIHPIGSFAPAKVTNVFGLGFEGGYQTMDALGSMIMATIVVNSVKSRGYDTVQEQQKMTILAGVLAGIGLLVIYGGFVFFGATGSQVVSEQLSRVDLLLDLIKRLLGNSGTMILGLAVSLACLTTSVGLTATAANFLSETFPQVTYKQFVYVICGFSAFFAINGVDTIIEFSAPILSILYPVSICLIILTLFDGFIRYKSAYKGAALFAFIVALFQNLISAQDHINELLRTIHLNPLFSFITPEKINFDTPAKIIKSLPLAGEGFAWLVPAIVGAIIFMRVEKIRKNK